MSNNECFEPVKKVTNRYKNYVTGLIFVILIVWSFVYLDLTKLKSIHEAFSYAESILKISLSVVVALIVRWPLFATDPLAHGVSKESKYFKSEFPSRLIIEKYKIDPGSAAKIWFDILDKWSDKNSAHHSDWQTLFERTFSCRMVFYVSKILTVFIWLSILLIAISQAYLYFMNKPFAFEYDKVFVIATFGLIKLFLDLSNTIRNGKTGEYIVSGCWSKYREISEGIRHILKTQYLDGCRTLDKLKEKV